MRISSTRHSIRKHRKNNELKPKILRAFNWITAFFLLMFAYGLLKKGWIMLAGSATFGVVTDIHTQSAGFKSSKSYAMVVEYQDDAGITQTYASDIYSSPVLYDLGERVPLWYWRDWVLVKRGAMWTNTLLWGVFGLFFVFVRYWVKKSEFYD